MQAPPSRKFPLGSQAYAQYNVDNLWYLCRIKAHNVQTDTYLVEFETYKFTQQCHASQLFPVVLPLHEGHVGGGGGNGDMVAAFSLSSQGGLVISSAEGAEGTQGPSPPLPEDSEQMQTMEGPFGELTTTATTSSASASATTTTTTTTTTVVASPAVTPSSSEEKRVKLQTLGAMGAQKKEHNARLKRLSTIDAGMVGAFKREEKLQAMSRFQLPSSKTVRLLAVHSMGPSRVHSFGILDSGSTASDEVDSESSASKEQQQPEGGMTLEQVITMSVASSSSSSKTNKNHEDDGDDAGYSPRGGGGGGGDSNSKRDLLKRTKRLSGFFGQLIKPAATVVDADGLKHPKGDEDLGRELRPLVTKNGESNLVNLVRLRRQRDSEGTAREQQQHEKQDPSLPVPPQPEQQQEEQQQETRFEVIVGNSCVQQESARSLTWTLFVSCPSHVDQVEEVVFGPMPPHGDMVSVREAPFEVTREVDLAHLNTLDGDVRVVVCFHNRNSPSTMRHPLSWQGSMQRFYTCDSMSGQVVLRKTLIEEEPVKTVVERLVRGQMMREDQARNEDIGRLSARLGGKHHSAAAEQVSVALGSEKKKSKLFHGERLLRPALQIILERIWRARSLRDHVESHILDGSLRSDCITSASGWCEFAPDPIACNQFVEALGILLESDLYSTKHVLRAAKACETALEDWPKQWRSGKRGGRRIPVEEFEALVSESRNPPQGMGRATEEEEFQARVKRELERREAAATKRKTLMSKSKGMYGEKFAISSEDMSELLAGAAGTTGAVAVPLRGPEGAPSTMRPVAPAATTVLAASHSSSSSTTESSDEDSSPLVAKRFVDGDDDSDRLSMRSTIVSATTSPLRSMGGNPLMTPSVTAASSSSSAMRGLKPRQTSLSTPESPRWRQAVQRFSAADYVAISTSANEAQLMASSVVLYFRSPVVDEPLVKEMFYLIANPSRSEIFRDMPNFRKPVQRLRAGLKLVHMASVIVKERIQAVGACVFSTPALTVSCLSLLWQCLLPLSERFEGDLQMRNLHDSLRKSHFCDILELLRMYFREPLLAFLRDSMIVANPNRYRPVPVLLDHLDDELVLGVFLSLLGAELVMPRKIWFSEVDDLVSLLMRKMVLFEDSSVADERAAENASHALKRILSSQDHIFLTTGLLERQRELHELVFGAISLGDKVLWNEKTFRFSVRVLSDWALLTLGGFRELEPSVLSKCVETTCTYLPLVRDTLRYDVDFFFSSSSSQGHSRRPAEFSLEPVRAKKIGFARLELINYVASLVNARNARIDEAIIAAGIIETVCDLFFATMSSSLLHSHVTDFIFVPMCEDMLTRLLENAIWKAKLPDRIMEVYVPLAGSGALDAAGARTPLPINGFLTIVALAISKTGLADHVPGWRLFVETKVVPTSRIQQPESSFDTPRKRPANQMLVVD